MQITFFKYRAFHGFGQAKFANGGSAFRLEPIVNTAPAALKSNTRFKRGQNRLKNKQLASLI